MHARALLLGGAIAVAFAGCGRVDFGNGCEDAATLVAPWTEMGLPLEEGQSRVCEASAEELKVRSYSWTKPEQAASALEQALTSAGWAKDRCSGQACYFDKDGVEVSVQPMAFTVKKKELVTLVMRSKADPRQARAAKPPKDSVTAAAARSGDEAQASAAGGGLGVAECDAYVAKVEGCPTFDRKAKPYTMMIDAWTKKIAAGEGDAVATACSKATQMFRCSGA